MELSQWQPDTVSDVEWKAYMQELLSGGNNEPFYDSAELSLHEDAFFNDTTILSLLDNTWRTPKVPSDFLKDKSNWRRFWKKHAISSDEKLFQEFILKRQGVVSGSILRELPAPSPLSGPEADPVSGRKYAILASSDMHTLAERLVVSAPERFSYYVSKWRKFPDGTDNITLGGFDPDKNGGVDRITGKDVLFLASFHNNESTMSQLHALTFLCDSAFLNSLTILLAYLPTGTMERYLQPGRVPAANTTAKLLSQLPATGGKKTRVMIYDVHAPPTQYFFTGSTACTLHTACPLAVSRIAEMPEEERINCIAFPDDGAAKRFSKFFSKHLKGIEIVVCSKIRTKEGNQRLVVIADGDPFEKRVLVMDDLVQTGGTLYECAVALKKSGATSVIGFATHAVFPDQSWKRFLTTGDRGVFDSFWLTNSNPTACEEIPAGDVFEALDLTPRIVRDLILEPCGRGTMS